MRMMVDELEDLRVPGDPNHYRGGTLPSRDPARPHRVVIAVQTEDGTRNAAAICADMARSFPGLGTFVMCGIAGGVPAPHQPDRHVRLGDIVVATKGVVDYDHVWTVDGTDTLRRSVQQPSKALLRADRELEMKELAGELPWGALLGTAQARAAWFRRPAEETDPLASQGPVEGRPDTRPEWPVGSPRVHRAAVGSADRLLRDAARRDALAGRHQIRAVEMEGSGVAVAADLHERQWFMVRGVADYCDNRTKSDVWHPYAALVAAAYVRALLAETAPFVPEDRRPAGPAPNALQPNALQPNALQPNAPQPNAPQPNGLQPNAPQPNGLQAIVDALMGVPAMRDDYQRRAVLNMLPEHIRTAVPDSVVGRLHVVGLVRTCEHYPGGREALLDALRLTFGVDDPDYRRINGIVERHWSGG
ncbi:effector-associated domain 2-containing protein [Plantactinospora sp. CA-294935]|uniref:effector-associated domain 2-containing protein n=1 Tax=Plantactinospora sp. CA-294935 TaxID=3240012 RepID=UPI003D8D8E8A